MIGLRCFSLPELQDLTTAENLDLPSLTEIRGSAAALLRIQFTYLLDTTSLAKGDIHGYITRALEPEDMIILGTSIF